MERRFLFQQITIGNAEIKNRLAMMPLCLNYNLKGGLVSNQTKAFFGGRAKDGLGLIIAGTLTVSNVVRIRRVESGFMMMDHTAKPGLFELAEMVHLYGCKIFMQFSYGFGHQTSSKDQWPDPAADPIAASAVGFKLLPSGQLKKAIAWHKKAGSEFQISKVEGLMPREATIEEIEEIEDTQAEGALALKQLGYDGIEIHCGHGYFGAGFLSPRINRRTDRYGGSPEKRMTFLKNLFTKSREKVGDDFVIGMRINVAEHVPGGQTVEDTKFYCQEMERLGLNYISLTDGCYEAFNYYLPEEDGTMLEGASVIKKAVKIPVITPSVHDPDLAEKAVAQGKTDMIGLARAILADPHWVSKAATGKRPVRCIKCGLCWDHIVLGLPIRCSVNPECGFEQYLPEYLPERPIHRVWPPHLRPPKKSTSVQINKRRQP
jgi:2,4-dienoyl-CoA reductase-like NADH-dependent reductase (Old Yellow Enzyme family)